MFMYTLHTLHFTRYTTKYIPGAQLPGFSPTVPLAVPLEVPLRRGHVVTAGPRAGTRSLTHVRQHVPPEVAGSRGHVHRGEIAMRPGATSISISLRSVQDPI